jgi:1,4-dihydroxy-2-naphthoate octaprenyltransferase
LPIALPLRFFAMSPLTTVTAEHPGTLKAWAAACRPASLALATGPVLVGAAMGYLHAGPISLPLAAMALAGALLMQLLTNLQNDIGFTQRGGERVGQRTGLPRATAKGWLSVWAVRAAIVALCLLSLALGGALVWLRGWPVLAMGLASMLAALAYMGGPKPIAYTPLGELTVFVFFGLVAVLGTDWLLTNQLSLSSLLAASCIGCLSAAALAVNNHRDHVHDRLVGRQTFVVRFGTQASIGLFTGLLSAPFVLCLVMAWEQATPLFLLPLLWAPQSFRLQGDFRTCPPGLGFNALLFRVFRLELWFALALAAAAVLARWLA